MPAIIEFPTIVQQAVEQFGGYSPTSPSGGISPNI